MHKIFLYTTSACHLCEIAYELLVPIADRLAYEIVMVEITDCDQLMEKYGVRIPVLGFENSVEELAWPFSEIEIERFFLLDLKLKH